MSADSNSSTDEKMTPEERGKLGGDATALTHDEKFYQHLGEEGGNTSSGSFAEGPQGMREKDVQSQDKSSDRS